MTSAHRAFPILFLAVGLVALTPGCDEKEVPPTVPANVTAVAPPAPKIERTRERLIDRSRERWAKIEKEDWVSAYDFGAPELKRDMPLARYLSQVSYHEYKNAKVVDVVQLDKDDAALQISVVWTPHHPQLAKAQLPPGETLTEEIEMIETWRWTGIDWSYVKPDRVEDFYQAHPELLKKSEPKPAQSEPPPK